MLACTLLLQDLGAFHSSLNDSALAHQLQPVDTFMTKVIQLHQTLQVRFGVTVVGPAGAGKSAAWKVLAAALSAHATAHHAPGVLPVQTKVLNPKAVSMKVRACVFVAVGN